MSRHREQDACPGALQVHQAADGALARVRLPGGMISPTALAALAVTAEKFGSGVLELTGRGNVQLRGITDTDAVAAAVADAGLLPSPSHERVRNIVASPLSGRAGGSTDVRGLVTELDTAIQADPQLADIGGRFWFSLDDGRGDVSGLGADVGAHALADGLVAILLAGVDTGIRAEPSQILTLLVEIASRFAMVRGSAWRVSELVDPAVLLAGFIPQDVPGTVFDVVTRPPVGWIPQDRGPAGRVALGAGVRLGQLSAKQAQFLAAVDAPVVITPWRSVLLCDLDEGVADVALRVLAPMELVFDENSPWLDVSACTGSPGCARSAADVRADAAQAVAHGPLGGTHRHFVGCDRACGSPRAGEVLVATGDGYRQRVGHP